jgi:hypothetical protein
MVKTSVEKDIFLANKEGPTFINLKLDSFFHVEPNTRASDDASGETGEDGSGSMVLSVEQLCAYLRALLIQDLRQRADGQRKFGICPISEDPNKLLGKKTSHCGFAESPQPHPLLAQSQQFSGDDPKMSAIPSDNPKARESFPELRLAKQLQQKMDLGRKKSVTLAR